MNIDVETFGAAVKRVRTLRNLTQRTVAEHVGVTSNYISLMENGERSASIETINALAAVLSIPAACLTLLGSKANGRRAGSLGRLMNSTQAAIWAAIEADADN